MRALTDRQEEVARLVAEGWSRRDIARTLGLSASTVKRHVENIALRLEGVGPLRARIVRYVLARETEQRRAA